MLLLHESTDSDDFRITKSDVIPQSLLRKVLTANAYSNLRYFEVSLSIQTRVFSELFPILTSQTLQHNGIPRTAVSQNVVNVQNEFLPVGGRALA